MKFPSQKKIKEKLTHVERLLESYFKCRTEATCGTATVSCQLLRAETKKFEQGFDLRYCHLRSRQ